MASVLEKTTSNGVTADENGKFIITVANTGATLVVSAVGYTPREIKVGTSATISITLQEVANLSEVVVTAMGISREKKALGYATQEIKAADLNRNLQPNIVNAMQGKVAGVTISSVGGGPGQGASIRIRGVNSINPNQAGDPLFVIDGVLIDNSTSTLGAGSSNNVRSVGNRASDLNPEDVESINILKGGAATALYGLRGSNGVVVITTKRGKSGAMQVNFSSTYGFENINKIPETQLVYTAGIVGVYTPIGLGPAWGPTIAEAKVIDPTHPDKLYDNYKQAYETGNQWRNAINVAGGTENVRYFSSVSYFTQEGMLPFTDYKNFSARLNTDIKLSSKLKASVNLNYTKSGGYKYDADRFGESLAYFSGRWDVKDYVNPDGTQVWRGTNNPIFGAATNRLKDDVDRIIGGINLSYSPFKWLDLSYRVGLDNYNDNRLRTAPGLRGIAGERNYDNEEGFVGVYNTTFRAINSTFLASASFNLMKDLKTSVRVGQELYDRRIRATGTLGSKLGQFDWYNLRNAAVLTPSDSYNEYRLMGIFGEATFDYKNFLFLSVTGRNDITSSLLKPNNSFFYPSVNLGYVLSEHVKMPDFIDYVKLRLSYARIGKDAPPYATLTGYTAYSSLPSGITGFTRAANLGDPELKPEFTNTYEGGVELRFLNNRLSIDATYYHSLSEDQILPVNISSATGYASAFINAGSMRNKGIELILKGTPVITKNFTWDASINFAANRNKVVSLSQGLTEIPYATHPGYGNAAVTMKLIPGEAFGNLYGTHYLRYYGSDPQDPRRTDKSRPVIIGANGFPALGPVSSQKLLGNSQPDWLGGMTHTFTYKRLTLTALIDARWGFEKYNRLDNFFAAFGIATYTLDRRDFKVFDGVLADGSKNTKSVWLGQGTGPDGVAYGEGYYRLNYRTISEPFIQDASWVRLRSASLSYALPTKWFGKNSIIRNATVSATGNNLWLHTNYFGLDPETVSADAGSNVDGFSGFTYPAPRTFLFTLNVGF
jgi:TonB-linked SusC/RagA family outer membrane protein